MFFKVIVRSFDFVVKKFASVVKLIGIIIMMVDKHSNKNILLKSKLSLFNSNHFNDKIIALIDSISLKSVL